MKAIFSLFALAMLAADSFGQCGSASSMAASSCGSSSGMQAVYGPLGFFRGFRQAGSFDACGSAAAMSSACSSSSLSTVSFELPPVQVASVQLQAAPIQQKVSQTMVDPKGLREVSPDPSMGLFQDTAGNMYYLNRAAVAASSQLMPAGKWVWVANNP